MSTKRKASKQKPSLSPKKPMKWIPKRDRIDPDVKYKPAYERKPETIISLENPVEEQRIQRISPMRISPQRQHINPYREIIETSLGKEFTNPPIVISRQEFMDPFKDQPKRHSPKMKKPSSSPKPMRWIPKRDRIDPDVKYKPAYEREIHTSVRISPKRHMEKKQLSPKQKYINLFKNYPERSYPEELRRSSPRREYVNFEEPRRSSPEMPYMNIGEERPIYPEELRRASPERPMHPEELRRASPERPMHPEELRRASPRRGYMNIGEERRTSPERPMHPEELRRSSPRRGYMNIEEERRSSERPMHPEELRRSSPRREHAHQSYARHLPQEMLNPQEKSKISLSQLRIDEDETFQPAPQSLSKEYSPPAPQSLSKEYSPPAPHSLSKEYSPPAPHSLSKEYSPPAPQSLSKEYIPPVPPTIESSQQIMLMSPPKVDYNIYSFFGVFGGIDFEIALEFDKRIGRYLEKSKELAVTTELYKTDIDLLPWKFDSGKFSVYENDRIYDQGTLYAFDIKRFMPTETKSSHDFISVLQLLNESLFMRASQNFPISLIILSEFINPYDFVVFSEYEQHPFNDGLKNVTDDDALSFILQSLLALAELHNNGIAHQFIDERAFVFRSVTPGGYFVYNRNQGNDQIFVENKGFVLMLSNFQDSVILCPKYATDNYYGERNCMIRDDGVLVPLNTQQALFGNIKWDPGFLWWNYTAGTRNRVFKDENLQFDHQVDLNNTRVFPPMEYFPDIQNIFAVILGNASKLLFESPDFNNGTALSPLIKNKIKEKAVVEKFPWKTVNTAKYLCAEMMIKEFYDPVGVKKPVVDNFFR